MCTRGRAPFFLNLNGHTAQRSPEPLSFKKGPQRLPPVHHQMGDRGPPGCAEREWSNCKAKVRRPTWRLVAYRLKIYLNWNHVALSPALAQREQMHCLVSETRVDSKATVFRVAQGRGCQSRKKGKASESLSECRFIPAHPASVKGRWVCGSYKAHIRVGVRPELNTCLVPVL